MNDNDIDKTEKRCLEEKTKSKTVSIITIQVIITEKKISII